MNKEVQVVLLLTDKPKVNGQNIYRKGEGNLKLPITGAEARRLAHNGYSAFNLYLVCKESTSNDKYLYYDNGELSGIVERDGNKFETTVEPLCKKLIATTDKSIHFKTPEAFANMVSGKTKAYQSFLPQIPQQFYRDFVDSKGTIKSVLIEMNEPTCKCDTMEKVSECIYSIGDDCRKPHNEDFYGHNPKTTIDNEVIIHLIESKK